MDKHHRKSGFSLLELSIVIGIVSLIIGMSLSIGSEKIEQERIRETFNELKVIQNALHQYAQRNQRMPCPAPINAATTAATYGHPAADCDDTPSAGVTHANPPKIKTGAVPFQVLGLSGEFTDDAWGNRYTYAVSDRSILNLNRSGEGVIGIYDRANEKITDKAVFVVFSAGSTGLGATNHEKLTVEACSTTQLDKQNCSGSASPYIDASIRETDDDATFYDDLLVWSNNSSIFPGFSKITTETPILTCESGSGVVFNGAVADDYSGRSVASAGDINGDGYDDIFISAPSADPNGSGSGQSYIVFGKATIPVSQLELSALDGVTGFKINGIEAATSAGYDISSLGDINYDGYDDIILGAARSTSGGSNSAEAYVVFGKATGWTASLDLSTLDGTTGFKIVKTGSVDHAVSFVGGGADINGDGFHDILISTTLWDTGGSITADAYVIFGKATSFGASLNVSALDGTNGFAISDSGASALPDPGGGGGAGTIGNFSPIANAGDLNGDGIDEIMIGSWDGTSGTSYPGSVAVIFGDDGAWPAYFDISFLDGTNGFVANGVAAGDVAGHAISSAGDVNGDGFDEIVIGAHKSSAHGTNSGEAYLVFGQASWSSSVNLSGVGSPNVLRIGHSQRDGIGYSASSAGDTNGDGYDDIIIGSDGNGQGESYLLLGKNTAWTNPFDLKDLTETQGMTFLGIDSNDHAGAAVASAGDVNGDGYSDLLIGAEQADPNGSNSGETYLLFGSNVTFKASPAPPFYVASTYRLETLAAPRNECGGCTPACSNECDGTTLNIFTCNADECEISSSVANSSQCSATKTTPPDSFGEQKQ